MPPGWTTSQIGGLCHRACACYDPDMSTTQAPRANVWQTAQQQFDIAAERLGLARGIRAVLRAPQRELMVRFPVKMDSGELEVFEGYRVQHNLTRGPAKGGVRYHPRRRRSTRCGRWRCG